MDCPAFVNVEPNPAGCFFDVDIQFQFQDWWYNPDIVKSCAVSCEASLGELISSLYPYSHFNSLKYIYLLIAASGDCKFCPTDISVLDFGVKDKSDQVR